jgi:hypothetical protein
MDKGNTIPSMQTPGLNIYFKMYAGPPFLFKSFHRFTGMQLQINGHRSRRHIPNQNGITA